MKTLLLVAAVLMTTPVKGLQEPLPTEAERVRLHTGEIVESRSREEDGLTQRVLGIVDAPVSWIATELRALCRPASKRVSAARLLVARDAAALLAAPPAQRTQASFSGAASRPCVLPAEEQAGFVYSEAALPVLGKKWTVLRYHFENTKDGAVVVTTTSVAGDLGEVRAVVVLRPIDQHRTLYASASTFKVPFPVPDFLWKREPSEGAQRIRMLRDAGRAQRSSVRGESVP